MPHDNNNLLSDKEVCNRKYSIDYIKKKINELSSEINAPQHLFPTYEYARGDGTPHIEVDRYGFMSYVISERGKEFQRKETDDIDDLLYWIFEWVTFSMALDYELNNRIEDKDCRRIIFSKQEELLGELKEPWRERLQSKHRDILKLHPFDDLASLRAAYFRELRQEGHSEAKINKMAYEKYPMNGKPVNNTGDSEESPV